MEHRLKDDQSTRGGSENNCSDEDGRNLDYRSYESLDSHTPFRKFNKILIHNHSFVVISLTFFQKVYNSSELIL